MKQLIAFILAVFSLFIITVLDSCTTDDLGITGPDIDVPVGFELEKLYAPQDHDQGSWVSIAEGPDRRFYTCDQYGGIYTFIMPSEGEKLSPQAVDSVELNMGYAQGLLWAYNSLYAVVVRKPDEENPDKPTSGIYRLQDNDGDGKLESIKKILTVNGDGEHGPHTLRKSPDGKSLYFIAGNFNEVPDHMESKLPRNWGEDNLFPPYLDARGHANHLKAPGGWMAKGDPDGENWELIGAGFRNPFSFGINEDDEIFAYDADMEWDFGMPWYRPTRILHVTSGAEFGWRTGSGKWPVYLPDNLPAVENMSQGSPTAVIMGKDLKFPSRYRNGLFACDWSFGTIYFVDLKAQGSSYTGKKETFLTGTPLPISNALPGSDGHLYFTTGGRRLESHLYRLRYVGEESTEHIVQVDKATAASRDLRRSLEVYHNNVNDQAVDVAWPQLNHEDERIAYAARIAIEHQPISQWANKLYNEANTKTQLAACLAYARADGTLNDRIIKILAQHNWASLDEDDRLALLRTYQLLMIRKGEPSHEQRAMIINQLDNHYPSDSPKINREISQILLYLDAPNAIHKTMSVIDGATEHAQVLQAEILDQKTLERSEKYGPQIQKMIESMPPTESIHYVTILSHIKNGWTKELRTKYFEWFYEALKGKGGESYKTFLDNIRAKALDNVPEENKEYFNNMAGYYSPIKSMADLPQPIGPGGEYNLINIGELILWGDRLEKYEGNFEQGERAYKAALCYSCHRMNGNGGASGPDLTNIDTRFSKNDIINAVLSPNEEISDQYAFTLFTKSNGEKVSGRIVGDTDEAYTIYQSPFDMTITTEISKSDIVSEELSPISPMPPQLFDRLNEKEVSELIVYLLAGGEKDHKMYTKEE